MIYRKTVKDNGDVKYELTQQLEGDAVARVSWTISASALQNLRFPVTHQANYLRRYRAEIRRAVALHRALADKQSLDNSAQ